MAHRTLSERHHAFNGAARPFPAGMMEVQIQMITPVSLQGKNIGCIGCGNMGGAILGGLSQLSGIHLFGYNRTRARLAPLEKQGVAIVDTIPELAACSDLLLVGVKPYLVKQVLGEALPSLRPETVVLSIAAGVTLSELKEAIQNRCAVVRVMPNTPALVNAGIFALALDDPNLCPSDRQAITDMFSSLGQVLTLPEEKFPAFTALVGCGPAYVFHFMDALAEAGVTLGFTRQEALSLVTQLTLGSAKLAALPGSQPALLREQVCSPAGVTIAAINHLDRTAVRGHLIDAVLTAYRKS